eukprot:5620234-Amphidinium_carterae.2
MVSLRLEQRLLQRSQTLARWVPCACVRVRGVIYDVAATEDFPRATTVQAEQVTPRASRNTKPLSVHAAAADTNQLGNRGGSHLAPAQASQSPQLAGASVDVGKQAEPSALEAAWLLMLGLRSGFLSCQHLMVVIWCLE